ncbi:bifunctional 2-polyprenyl-6-hydroxyphenol methylase/3-demethylubiquinol 3-O-methyltransferase UbiG [Streptomyces sp. WAC06614]|uniref:class I SAM-dependent methyltransferase n=1 Tax=Streptomyces sp. WAC06614 TaxID=2487416 RepID=UPI000F78C9DA|nr:class I SAM-dependent methyltransferase [Streptomyces sp. WAC06614]RSS80832.1 class I SAM-dependent methyltransferase [Streptomyces sp. WAC06614]
MEQAVARRRFWDRFYRVPQECAPAVALGEVRTMARQLRPRPGRRASEVGCGRGSFSASLAALGLVATGYDWSEVGIRAARWSWRDPRVAFEVHDFLGGRAPAGVTDGSVDVLACRVTLQYLDTAFWSAARRRLRPGAGTSAPGARSPRSCCAGRGGERPPGPRPRR